MVGSINCQKNIKKVVGIRGCILLFFVLIYVLVNWKIVVHLFEYVVSCMGMMLFEIILCENGSRGYFAKLENAINFWI